MTNYLSFVSVIIPCRNEEKYIERCLDSVIKQDYPKEKMEVLVIDGRSEDRTRKIIDKFKIQNSLGRSGDAEFKIKTLDNPQKFTPFGLNIGIKNAQGEIIVRMDAHADYEKDYISKCVKYLKKYNADNVGGIMVTLPRGNTFVAKAIALALSHPFGVGGSVFRKGSKEIKWVDTVFGGCYKKEVFDKIGLFNEKLIRSQDMEFNLRLKKAGGRILLVPEIISYYYPKSNLRDFFIHNIKDGIWAILPLKFVKTPFKIRHYLPLFFILTLPLNIWLYIPASLYFSIKISIKEKNPKLFFLMPVVFAVRHFGYGFGSVLGALKLPFA